MAEKQHDETVTPVKEKSAPESKDTEGQAIQTVQQETGVETKKEPNTPAGKKRGKKEEKGGNEIQERVYAELEKRRREATEQRHKDLDFIAPYAKAYPKETTFHVTGDRQVFLGKDLSLAKNHQRNLKVGELRTIKVK